LKSLWKGFWQLADPKIWVASTIPMFMAFAFTFPERRKNSVLFFLLSIIAIYLIEIAKNALNEAVDYLSGADRLIPPENLTPFSGGKKTITGGLLTVSESVIIAVCCYGAAGVLGLLIAFLCDFNVLWIGILGAGLSILYSLPPFKLCYRGLGELAVGLTFGPLLVAGVSVVMTGLIDIKAMVCSITLGFFIADVLWINQYPDYEADKAAGKKNGVVRLGKEKAWIVFAFMFASGYLTMAAGAILIHPAFLLTLITVPMSVTAVRNARSEYDNIPKLIKSNVLMVKIYQITGFLMIISSIVIRLFPL